MFSFDSTSSFASSYDSSAGLSASMDESFSFLTIRILSSDVLAVVFSFLPPKCLVCLRLVSHDWNVVISTHPGVHEHVVWTTIPVEARNSAIDFLDYVEQFVDRTRSSPISVSLSPPWLCGAMMSSHLKRGNLAGVANLTANSFALSTLTRFPNVTSFHDLGCEPASSIDTICKTFPRLRKLKKNALSWGRLFPTFPFSVDDGIVPKEFVFPTLESLHIEYGRLQDKHVFVLWLMFPNLKSFSISIRTQQVVIGSVAAESKRKALADSKRRALLARQRKLRDIRSTIDREVQGAMVGIERAANGNEDLMKTLMNDVRRALEQRLGLKEDGTLPIEDVLEVEEYVGTLDSLQKDSNVLQTMQNLSLSFIDAWPPSAADLWICLRAFSSLTSLSLSSLSPVSAEKLCNDVFFTLPKSVRQVCLGVRNRWSVSDLRRLGSIYSVNGSPKDPALLRLSGLSESVKPFANCRELPNVRVVFDRSQIDCPCTDLDRRLSEIPFFANVRLSITRNCRKFLLEHPTISNLTINVRAPVEFLSLDCPQLISLKVGSPIVRQNLSIRIRADRLESYAAAFSCRSLLLDGRNLRRVVFPKAVTIGKLSLRTEALECISLSAEQLPVVLSSFDPNVVSISRLHLSVMSAVRLDVMMAVSQFHLVYLRLSCNRTTTFPPAPPGYQIQTTELSLIGIQRAFPWALTSWFAESPPHSLHFDVNRWSAPTCPFASLSQTLQRWGQLDQLRLAVKKSCSLKSFVRTSLPLSLRVLHLKCSHYVPSLELSGLPALFDLRLESKGLAFRRPWQRTLFVSDCPTLRRLRSENVLLSRDTCLRGCDALERIECARSISEMQFVQLLPNLTRLPNLKSLGVSVVRAQPLTDLEHAGLSETFFGGKVIVYRIH